jgi:hypothetical protein
MDVFLGRFKGTFLDQIEEVRAPQHRLQGRTLMRTGDETVSIDNKCVSHGFTPG